MKNKLAVSMLLILVLATIPIALRVEHVYASPSGPSLVVNDSINRVNATLGIKAGSKVTAKGVITNIGATTLNQLLTGVFFAEGTGVAVPGDFSFEFSLDCVTWFPIHPSEVKVAAPWTGYQVELVIGQAGGESLGPGSSSQMYLRMTVINDLTTVYGGALGLLQSMCVAVFKDANGNRHLDSGEPIYTQPPMYAGVIDWDNPIRIDLAIVHTAEIEGTGKFYYSIQNAVDAATSTIILYPGTYAPFTVSGKSNLIIVANGAVVVKGSQSVATHYGNRDAVIFVTGSTDITLDGLDIEGQGLGTTNPKSYAVIYESSSGTIKDCVVSPNTIGNVNGVGIAAWDYSDLVIDPCLIKNFGRIGVFFYDGCTGGVYDSTIEGQIYNDENLVNYGIEIEPGNDPCNVEIIGNDIYNCDNTHPSPSWSSAGIVIDGWVAYYDLPSSTVVIMSNDIYDNYIGIEVIANAYSCAHYNNIYSNREYGVVQDSDYLGNNVTFDARYNWWGAANGPYHPTLNPTGSGDRVSDYVDFIPWLPIMHEVAVINVSASPSVVVAGQIVTINVTTGNLGSDYENFTVTAYYDSTAIASQNVTNLLPNWNTTLTFNWNTTGMPRGNYTMKAVASTVLGETNTANNVFIDGEVQVLWHDVAVVNIASDRTWVFQGRSANINVTVKNNGDFPEAVTVTLYYNITAHQTIGLLNTSVLPGENQTVTFTWNTAGVPYCHNYTITAVATIAFVDNDPMDNTLTDGKIKVRILGDLNGDGVVDGSDIALAAWSFGSYGPDYLYTGSPPHPRWNPDADINQDGVTDGSDLVMIARNFGLGYLP